MAKIMGFLASFLVGGLAYWSSAGAWEDVSQHRSCPFCGMDRGKFAHSRMVVRYYVLTPC